MLASLHDREEIRTLTHDDAGAFAPPAAFGPFRVLHQIGIGVLGPVFRTYDPQRDRLVAVKVFRVDIVPEQAQAVAEELERIARLGLSHPALVLPLSAGVEGTAAYLATEYVAAESLDVAMRHYAPASLDKALPFLAQLAGAIDTARAEQLTHGALHPRDIFIAPEQARATGFGVTAALERVGVRPPVRRPYTAPERIAGERWGPPSDIYSLAAIGYELLTGHRLSGSSDQIDAALAEVRGKPNVSELQKVFASALSERPDERPPSAGAFVRALEQAAGTVQEEPNLEAIVLPAPLGSVDIPAPALSEIGLQDEAPAGREAASIPDDLLVFASEVAAPGPSEDHGVGPDLVSDVTLHDAPSPSLSRDESPLDQHIDTGLGRPSVPRTLPVDLDERDRRVRVDEDVSLPEPRTPPPTPEVPPPSQSSVAGLTPVWFPELEPEPFAEAAPQVSFEEPERTPEAATATPVSEADKTDPPVLLRREARARIRALREEREKPPEPVRPSMAARMIDPPPVVPAEDEHEEVVEPLDRSSSILHRPVPPAHISASLGSLILTLAVGLGLGLFGGYLLFSPVRPRQVVSEEPRGAATAGRQQEFSEQPVAEGSAGMGDRQEADASAAAGPKVAGPEVAASAPTKGRLIVRSTPGGARVSVNGEPRGVAPVDLKDLPFGDYAVEVTRAGYATQNRQVSLSPAHPASVNTIELSRQTGKPAPAAVAKTAPPANQRAAAPAAKPPAPTPPPKPTAPAPPAATGAPVTPSPSGQASGSLTVDSRPAGATVSIDGRPAGTTPLRVADLSPGVHKVQIELAGYRPWTSSVTIKRGAPGRVAASLDR